MVGDARQRAGRGLQLCSLLVLASMVCLPSFAMAANYGAGNYGGGPFGQGAAAPTTPAPVPTNTAGSGGVIGGPLSVGYIYVAPVVATTTSSAAATSVITGLSSTTTSLPAAALFTRSLQFRDVHPDVKRLQSYLNTQGFVVTTSGGGSPGDETDYFGSLTLAALKRFQQAHREEILKPLGLAAPSGYFGPATRAFVSTF